MVTTLSTYSGIANNITRWQTATSNDPNVKQATAYFNANIGKVKTASDLINNYQLFTYAMTAFGLSDMIYAKGLMTQVLQQGVKSSSALANTLHNQNIKAFATAFDFATNGSKTTSSKTLLATVNSKYVEQSLETKQGQSNTAVQLALNFAQKAPTLTDAYGILADKNLLTVVQTTLGIPAATSAQDITIQFNEISKKINVKDFKTPAKLNAFIARFCAQADLNGLNTGSATTNSSLPASLVSPLGSNSTSSTGLPSSLVSPFGGGASSQPNFSTDLLMSLQNLKLGG